MKTRKKNRSHYGGHTARARTCEPQFTDQIRRLIHIACAARAGAAHMTLSDWREVEQEVKQRVQYEG